MNYLVVFKKLPINWHLQRPPGPKDGIKWVFTDYERVFTHQNGLCGVSFHKVFVEEWHTEWPEKVKQALWGNIAYASTWRYVDERFRSTGRKT